MADAKSRKLTKARGDSAVLQQKVASRDVVFPQHLLPSFHRVQMIGFAPNYPPATLYNVSVRYFSSLSSLSLVQNHRSPLSTTAGRARVSARAGGVTSFVIGDGGRSSPARAHPALSSSPRAAALSSSQQATAALSVAVGRRQRAAAALSSSQRAPAALSPSQRAAASNGTPPTSLLGPCWWPPLSSPPRTKLLEPAAAQIRGCQPRIAGTRVDEIA